MVETQEEAIGSREGDVLIGLVDEYIRSARPVGSQQLVHVLGLTMSPATVRNIFRVLEDGAYVRQPHTSAGRVPTDKGYRYYVDHQRAARISRRQLERLAVLLAAYRRQYHSPAQVVARALAETTGALAAAGWLRDHDVSQAGFTSLARQLANIPHESVCEVLEIIDSLEMALEQFSELDELKPQVYIGEENPVMHTKHTSVVAHRIHSNDQEIVLLLVGPKHMPYTRNVAWLNGVSEAIEELDI